MANFNCVEPGQAGAGGTTVVLATAADSITFPAIDSCFGIGFILADGALVGGHVPALWDDSSFKLEVSKYLVANTKGGGYNAETGGMPIALDNVLAGMNVQRNGRKISVAVTLGDNEWYEFWDTRLGSLGYPKALRYRKPNGQRNLIIDGTVNTVQVEVKMGAVYMPDPTKTRAFTQGQITSGFIAC